MPDRRLEALESSVRGTATQTRRELALREPNATKRRNEMKSQWIKKPVSLLAAACLLATGTLAGAADAASRPSVPVTITVTASVAGDKRMPDLTRDDVVVRQGKSRLEITDWVPARGDRAGLELFILIDENADSRISLQYPELRDFIYAQPPTTSIGVGYMRNATVQIAQQLTANRDLATRALRMPIGNGGSFSSPYLSVTDLMKSWPVDENRREVIMITDGIGRDRHHHGWHTGYRTDADADSAISVAQRTGTNIFTIYTPGSARAWRGTWAGINGQMNMTRLSDATGAASFYLGLHAPVSIAPYLGQVQRMLDNQYLLSFVARSGKKSGLQSINLSTEVAGVDLNAHDAVWVAGGK